LNNSHHRPVVEAAVAAEAGEYTQIDARLFVDPEFCLVLRTLISLYCNPFTITAAAVVLLLKKR
jgi:hypothetical protein